MPDNFYNSDEPTQPGSPPQQGAQGQQGKLVLGSFQDAQQRAQRQPYQYPPQQSQQPYYPGQQQGYQQFSGQAQYSQQQAPAQRPNPGSYPYQQPGQMAGNPVPLPPLQPRRRPRRRNGCAIGCLVLLLLLIGASIFTFGTAQRVLAFGSAISTQSPLSTQTNYMGTSERTNVLIMGYGGGSHDGANLTDSMVVVSLLPQSHHTSLISVPRDLWVQYPPNSGQYTKINGVYEDGSNNGKAPKDGGAAAAQKVALVTGLDVKYWLTINFDGFRELINSIGGIDVYVPDSFTAEYPKNDDPNIDASYIKIHFNKGNQHMDGETAIRYARARKVLDNQAEGTDFARSARQQIIIKAALSKVKQVSTWPHLFNAMDALQKTIYTNMSLADLSEFAMKMDLNDPKTAHIGLSNQNELEDAYLDDGTYILRPRNGNWKLISAYVKQHLYS